MKIVNESVHLSGNLNFSCDPAVTRDGNRILLDGIEIHQNQNPILGLALDLGTTTIVLRLLNLETGKIIAESSFENPQRFGGSDVMSRILYDTEQVGVLQKTITGYLTHAIEEFPFNPHNIYEMTVAGNSTMRDIFFGLSVYSIGQNPYRSISELEMDEGKRVTTSLSMPAKDLCLPIHPAARVYGLPVISGHVGADAAACMLASNIGNEDRLVAIMDMGTNTELILGNKYKILAASCPAGPAFEGGNISCGMPGLPGAIEKVKIHSDDSVSFKVIDDCKPAGICGSGLIDIASELLDSGHINKFGRFVEKPGVNSLQDSSGYENNKFNIYRENGSNIFITEKDINELAQAKGANTAGLQIVFETYGIQFEDIDIFYLAGGFGRYLAVESAKRIGLIPNIDSVKVMQIGNASIEGACIALLSNSKRSELERLVKKVTHCRLESSPDFFNYFTEGCQFKPIESVNGVQ